MPKISVLFFNFSVVGGRRFPRRAPRSEREPYRRIFGLSAPVGAPGEPKWARGRLQRSLGRTFLPISSASRPQSAPQGVYKEVWGRFLRLLGPSRRPRRQRRSLGRRFQPISSASRLLGPSRRPGRLRRRKAKGAMTGYTFLVGTPAGGPRKRCILTPSRFSPSGVSKEDLG